jgi:hypothetical protein
LASSTCISVVSSIALFILTKLLLSLFNKAIYLPKEQN